MPQQVPLPTDISTAEGRATYLNRTEEHDKQTVAGKNGANNNGNTHQDQPNKLDRDNENNANANISNNKTTTVAANGDALKNPTNNNNNNNITSANQTNSIETTKLNGLKNRIIQRPPPLILDKVSNFYDNHTQSYNATQSSTLPKKPQLPHSTGASSHLSASNLLKSANNINNINNNNNTQDQQQQVILNQNNSANHKFWASLNLNAQSRTKNSLANRNATDSNSMTIPNQQQLNEHSINSRNSNNNTIVGATQLGVDLIITNRKTNNCTTVGGASSGSLNASNIASQSSVQKQQQIDKQITFNQERLTSDIRDDSIDDNKPNDMFKNPEFDDSSTHGGTASENDGGNLIGVHNPTPPTSTGAVSDSHRAALEEPPVSATSSRPRSNNPFLASDEELLSNIENETNFHKRPASFIAATDSKSFMLNRQQQLQQQQQQQQTSNLYNSNHLHNAQQQITGEQFGKMPIGYHNSGLQLQNQDRIPYINPKLDQIVVNQQSNLHADVRDSSMYGTSSMIPQQHLQSIYATYCQNSDYINYEPTISLDSESAVRKPPPSAIMQLPHWTDAIYELNNAILETSSVAGGAENGEFVYIVQSGDIILELDQIKVSGFTLIEFNQLVESKPVHLLSAVQTRHSHGLTTDLKHFLNCSFPKNSLDKGLQDLIRENIYRRTIPCTTRPPRPGEVDKIDYHFLSREQFVEMNNRGMLLECGMFGDHYYGTMQPFCDLSSLSIYGTLSQKGVPEEMYQPMYANHPAIDSSVRTSASIEPTRLGENPLYENHESLRMNQAHIMNGNQTKAVHNVEGELANLFLLDNQNRELTHNVTPGHKQQQSSPIEAGTEVLPHGWERVIDQTHGTYYIDHNTQRTQYERPYEIELTKGAMGFGFTLVEADSGVLLVRSVIPGGPAQLDGTIRPGDILLSAVGVPVAGLQHTGIARLFSTFAIGDRIRLTFARSTYVVDVNLVPDEYLFSNGTNGDLTVAVNSSSYHNYFNQNMADQDSQHQILVDQEFEYITVALMRGDQGFGFTISDSMAGQKVRKIQNNETCVDLKQGDILISLNGQDITKLTHKEVVERLKNFPAGQSVTVTVKRKKRSRSKTPMSIHSVNHQDEYSLNNENEYEYNEYEYYHVDLDRGNEDSNWGIRLIGGSEVDRAISIGSIVLGGAAYKNGQLKSGDEIIRINGLDVVGATHQHVVELISACQRRASLIVRRKKFSEACEVALSRNMDEGFGFVIISSGNCALIGRIIEDSPADRCQQLHVRDRIIAVNGRYITPNMQHPEIVNMIKDCGNTLKLRIIPADSYTVELIKSSQNDNFGFSMRGGSEYDGTPLYILRVAPNGLAKDLLNVGDQIIEINNISTMGMTHRQAATIIKFSEPIVKLKLRRSSVIPLSLLVDSPRALQKYNQVTAEMKTVNSSVTPNYFNDGSATSEQHLSLGEELQQQQQQRAIINNMGYNTLRSELINSLSSPTSSGISVEGLTPLNENYRVQ